MFALFKRMETNDLLIAANCPECEIQFSSTKAFQLHFSEQHQKIKEEFELCNTTARPNSQEKCIEIPSQVEVIRPCHAELFPCQSCSYVTKTKQLLQKHVQTQHDLHRKIYSCHLCTYFCLQERTFNLHLLKHTKVEAKFACDQCGKLFMSMGIMKRHALTHTKSKPFICDTEGCDKSFNIRSRLTDHKRSVHKSNASSSDYKRKAVSYSREKILLKRDKCPFQLNKSDWRGINSRVRSDGQCNIAGEHYLCSMSKYVNSVLPDNDICSSQSLSQFSCNGDYESDAKNSQHPNVVNVYDVILSDTFTSTNVNDTGDSSESLSNRVSILKPPDSFKKFLFKDGQKNTCKFRCSWKGCGKVFRDGYNLRMHMCTHTGEMQRACKLCGYTCVQKSALDRHMRVHQRTVTKRIN